MIPDLFESEISCGPFTSCHGNSFKYNLIWVISGMDYCHCQNCYLNGYCQTLISTFDVPNKVSSNKVVMKNGNLFLTFRLSYIDISLQLWLVMNVMSLIYNIHMVSSNNTFQYLVFRLFFRDIFPEILIWNNNCLPLPCGSRSAYVKFWCGVNNPRYITPHERAYYNTWLILINFQQTETIGHMVQVKLEITLVTDSSNLEMSFIVHEVIPTLE